MKGAKGNAANVVESLRITDQFSVRMRRSYHPRQNLNNISYARSEIA